MSGLLKNFKLLSLTLIGVLYSQLAYAAAMPAGGGSQIDDISANIVESTMDMPGLLTGLCYLIGLLLGVSAVLKIREHVENPNQTALRVGIIGGALFALPIVFEAAYSTFDPIGGEQFTPPSSFTAGAVGGPAGGGGVNGINEIAANIMDSIDETPGIVTAISYLLGLLMCVAGVLKIREHVENPDQVPVKESVARLVLGGALFALPTIFNAVYYTIINDPANANLGGVIGSLNFFASAQSDAGVSACGSSAAGQDGLGYLACQLVSYSTAVPSFLEAISYIFGMILAVWGLIKIRDHVLNTGQTTIWDGVSRILAAGGFFAMPYVSEVLRTTVADTGSSWFTFVTTGNTGFQHGGTVTGECGSGAALSLDFVMGCFMQDIMAPLHILLNFFAWVAGLVLIMIGISRLMKSAQDGARAPGGIGTLMTFLVGGILISYNAIVGAVSASFFDNGPATTRASLSYTKGMSADEIQHVEIVSEAIIQFMIIVGLISFVRGWFIMRDVAEGSQQASLMAGTTHILAGALAINMGPLLNAVQTTLNVGAIGMTFN